MKTLLSVTVLLAAVPCWAAGHAPDARITVHADQCLGHVSRYLTGACLEDVNHEIYGGIYSQMIFGESFQEPSPDGKEGNFGAISRMWSGIRRGTAAGRFAITSDRPFVGVQAQHMSFVSGEGQWGVENQGLNRWGMNFAAGKPYEGYVWARAKRPTALFLALESRDGSQTYAQTRLAVSGDDWQRLDFTLTPSAADQSGRFAVTLRQPGSVTLGHAFLQCGAWGRFQGLPVRKDVARALVDQGLTVLRYGGSMVNAAGYRWKKMIGPRDRRPPYKGTWYPSSTNGWGIVDFLDLCRAAGLLAVPAFNMDETPQDMADFIEYVNGTAASEWGKRRLADGYGEPYRLKYLELGNEEAVNEHYWRRFKPLAEAIWFKDPEVVLVVGDFLYEHPIKDPYSFSGAPSIRTLAAHKKILDMAKEHRRDVWFDVHVGTDTPHDWQGLGGVPSFIEALDTISPGAKCKVVIFEFNANHHHVGRALGNARAINEIQRLGDRVPIACSANCLQPYRQNDNGWNQGLLFLSPSQVWAQPPYDVTQMMSRHYLPKCVRAEVQGPSRSLDVTALSDEPGKVLQLQAVNLDDRRLDAEIVLDGFRATRPTARRMELQGPLEGVNTPDNPLRFVSRTFPGPRVVAGQRVDYTFPPHSFTILRFE
jgi:alpha-L-arabinofuranosidase